MPRVINKRLRKKYKDKTCFDMVLISDINIIKFLQEDPFNFVIEIDKKIFCGNKKEILTRRTVKNGNLAYLCLRAGDTYDIRSEDIVDEIPYLRMESVGLSQGQILISYNNIIEVIINSDDQIFVCKHMYDHLGNLLSSKSTVSLSVYINKASVVSGAHCQSGGDYPIYSVYSVTHPDERHKLNYDFIVPRSIKNKDINDIRRDIDVKLGLDQDELVEVYFPEEWSMVVRKNKPDYGLSKVPPFHWWNIKEGGRYRLQNDLIEIDDKTGQEINMEYLMMDFLEDKFNVGLTNIESMRETLENQIQRPDELPESIDDFIKRLDPDDSDDETEPGYEGFKIIHEILNLKDMTPWMNLRPQSTIEIEVYTYNGTDALPREPTMIFMIEKDVDLSLATIQQRARSAMVDAFAPIDVYLKRLDDGSLMKVGKLEFIHPAGAPIRGEIRLNSPSEDFPQPIEELPEFQAPPPTPPLSPRRLDFSDSSEEDSNSDSVVTQALIERASTYSLEPYIYKENYSNKDYVEENSNIYIDILYNEYVRTQFDTLEVIMNNFAVFKFLIEHLAILSDIVEKAAAKGEEAFLNTEEILYNFELRQINLYADKDNLTSEEKTQIKQDFENLLTELEYTR